VLYEWYTISNTGDSQIFVRKKYYYNKNGNLNKVITLDPQDKEEVITTFSIGSTGEWLKSIDIYNGKEGGGIEREISYQ